MLLEMTFVHVLIYYSDTETCHHECNCRCVLFTMRGTVIQEHMNKLDESRQTIATTAFIGVDEKVLLKGQDWNRMFNEVEMLPRENVRPF